MYVIVIKLCFCDSEAWYSRFSVSAWYTQVLNGCLLDDLEALRSGSPWGSVPLCHSEGGLSSSLSFLGSHRVQLEYGVQQCGARALQLPTLGNASPGWVRGGPHA